MILAFIIQMMVTEGQLALERFQRSSKVSKLLYDKVNRTCITFNVFFLNAYIMIPSHTGSALSTHTTLFGWVILITMMSLDPRLRSFL